MAHLFKPTYTRPIPPHATRVTVAGVRCVRWTGRGGRVVTARVSKTPGKCLVEVACWWISYADENGRDRTVRGSASKDVAADKMAQIVRRVEQIAAGMLPAGVVEARVDLELKADEYAAYLRSLRRTAKHAKKTRQRIGAILDGCKFRAFGDIAPGPVVRWLGTLRDGGLSVETSNGYLRAIKAFSKWLSFQVKSYNPLAEVRPLNADTDRRVVRRAVARKEFEKLLSATLASTSTFRGLAGRSRWALYMVASFTGLRAAELASLSRASLDLDGGSVEVEAAYAKGRRRDLLPLAAALMSQLRQWFADRPAGPLWPGTWHERAAEMLCEDLHAAGMLQIDTRGRVFDFHSLRGQFITDLARAGVSITLAQKLARHSTPALTSRYYTHLNLADLAEAADRLPPILSPPLVVCANL